MIFEKSKTQVSEVQTEIVKCKLLLCFYERGNRAEVETIIYFPPRQSESYCSDDSECVFSFP